MTDWQVFVSLTRFEMCFVVIINDVFFIKIWRGLTGRKYVITFKNLLGPNPEDKNNRDIKIFFQTLVITQTQVSLNHYYCHITINVALIRVSVNVTHTKTTLKYKKYI